MICWLKLTGQLCAFYYIVSSFRQVLFFFKHKNHSFVQKRLNWTNRCCKMFHILLCYFITIHCNLKIWQWCILASQSISVFSWVDRKHLQLANEDAPRRCNDVKIIVPWWNCIDNACHHKHAGPKTCFYTS